MKRIRIGFVGCGGIAQTHIQSLLQIEGAEVAALAAGNEARLKETAALVPGAALYTSGEEMLEKAGLDAVFLCVTPARHGNLEEIAANKGIHLYVEKPIGLNMAAVGRLAAIIEGSGIITSVGYQERYDPALEELRCYLAEHPAGVVSGKWMGGMPGALWWRQKAASGGQVVEQCTHIFDMLRYLFGEVESVYARPFRGIMKGIPQYDIEDASAAVLTFQSGMLADVITGCYLGPQSPPDVGLTIYTDAARVCYDWIRHISYREGDAVREVPGNCSHHFDAVKAFVEAVRTGNRSLIRSDFTDASRSLAVTLAVNESMERGSVVKL